MVMQQGEIINVPYGHSFPDYLDYRKSTTSFSDLVAFMPTPVHLSAPGQTPERTWIEVVSPNYFALARVAPAFGELLQARRGRGQGRRTHDRARLPLLAAALRRRSRRSSAADHPEWTVVHRGRHRARDVHRPVVGHGGERRCSRPARWAR